MTNEAIVLAGGLGTRLAPVVKDVPKPMANVAGRPFLNYILHFLSVNGIKRAVLALGHKHTVIEEYLSDPATRYGLQISYSIEEEPLGTGGAIFKAFAQIHGENAFIVNGDTYFEASLKQLEQFAMNRSAEIAFALKETGNPGRYGNVKLSTDGRIRSFHEKSDSGHSKALINGGIYYMKRSLIDRFHMPSKFSIEEDFYGKYVKLLKAYGTICEGIFIDIGVPDDYRLSQDLLKNVISG